MANKIFTQIKQFSLTPYTFIRRSVIKLNIQYIYGNKSYNISNKTIDHFTIDYI